MKSNWFRYFRTTLEMIRIEHTVFALPFALSGAILAKHQNSHLMIPLFWILLAMISARSAAMAFNRLVDEPFDRDNPRTCQRALPRGLVTKGYVVGFTIVCSFVFIFSAWMLNTLSFILSFPALAVILLYSFMKRFTILSHVILGFALSIAPQGAWIAVTGEFSPKVLVLCLVVVTWVAGFDILYACQDIEFDSQIGLFSIPVQFGVKKALWVSFLFHVLTALSLFLLLFTFQLSWIALIGFIVLSAILFWEHFIINSKNLSRINTSFFTLNGIFSILLFGVILVDVLFSRHF